MPLDDGRDVSPPVWGRPCGAVSAIWRYTDWPVVSGVAPTPIVRRRPVGALTPLCRRPLTLTDRDNAQLSRDVSGLKWPYRGPCKCRGGQAAHQVHCPAQQSTDTDKSGRTQCPEPEWPYVSSRFTVLTPRWDPVSHVKVLHKSAAPKPRISQQFVGKPTEGQGGRERHHGRSCRLCIAYPQWPRDRWPEGISPLMPPWTAPLRSILLR